jgi:hypothetical protein
MVVAKNNSWGKHWWSWPSNKLIQTVDGFSCTHTWSNHLCTADRNLTCHTCIVYIWTRSETCSNLQWQISSTVKAHNCCPPFVPASYAPHSMTPFLDVIQKPCWFALPQADWAVIPSARITNNTFKIILQLVIVFGNSTIFTPNILYNVASFQSIKILQYYRSFKCPVIWLTISTGPLLLNEKYG